MMTTGCEKERDKTMTEKELCVLKVREFDAGWNAAVEEVKEAVEGYMEHRRSGKRAASWDLWLPDYLDRLLENDDPTGEQSAAALAALRA